MGLMVDSNVFIRFEKSGKPIDFSSWENSEKVFISAIVVSELLSGVHRADTGHRCTGFHNSGGPRSCGHLCRLGKEGRMIGAHDLIIAATARFHDLAVLTDNVKEFSRVPGLRVVPFEV